MDRILRVMIITCVITTLASAQVQPNRGPLLDIKQARQKLATMAPDTGDCDILLITVDAMQVSRLSIFGGTNPEPMPNLKKLAAEGVVFERAYSPTPHRQTGLISIHHSLYPSTITGMGTTEKTDSITNSLADSGFNAWAAFRFGVTKSSDEPIGKIATRFDFETRRTSNSYGLPSIRKVLERRIANRRAGERFFGWIHLSYPYPPAVHHPGIRVNSTREGHYRAALQYVDKAIGQILGDVKRITKSDKTIVAVCGVHGLEKVPSSGKTLSQNALNERTLRVPLIIKAPGIPPSRVSSPVETIDVAPTLLDLSESEIPWSFQGRSLVPQLVEGSAFSEDRATFATHLRFANDPKPSTVQRVRLGAWTLHFGPLIRPAILRKDGSAENLISTNGEKATQLGLLLEEFQVMNESCSWLWNTGEQRPIDLRGADGDIARARFYSKRQNKKGQETARRIVKRGTDNLDEALEILIQVGSKEDTEDMRALLEHSSQRVRALAGALLLGTSAEDTALDHVAAGLRDELPSNTKKLLLQAIIQKRPARAKEILNRFSEQGEEEPGLIALNDLGLAQLGDEDAAKKLVVHLLTPNAPFDRLPLFEALKKLRPQEFVGLCRIILSHGDGDTQLAEAAIKHLFATDSRVAAQAVADAIKPSSSPSVRTLAIGLLNHWQSHAGVASCLELGRGDEANAGLAARVLFQTPAIFDSPVLPSRRFDHFAAERRDGNRGAIAQVADIFSKTLEFSLQVPSATYNRFAILFKATQANKLPLRPESLKVFVDINGKENWLSKGKITLEEGVFCFVGEMPAKALDPGTNTFSVYLRHVDKLALKAHALGFVLFPADAVKYWPIVGLDTHPLAQTRSVVKSEGHISEQSRKHILWIRRDGPGSAFGEIRVLANGVAFMRIPTKDLSTPRIFDISFPEGVNRDSRIELVGIDLPKRMSITALLVEKR